MAVEVQSDRNLSCDATTFSGTNRNALFGNPQSKLYRHVVVNMSDRVIVALRRSEVHRGRLEETENPIALARSRYDHLLRDGASSQEIMFTEIRNHLDIDIATTTSLDQSLRNSRIYLLMQAP